MFTLLEKNLESMEKEEFIAIDYLATDNNWHLSRFIVQSRTEDGTARQVLLVIRVISEEKRREKYLIDDVPFIREQEVSETTAEIPLFKLRPSRIIKTLLIAEDNDLNYEILEEQLEMYGIHCVRAVNGKECVQLFEGAPSGTYDAILMDMQMPVMNGLDAARAIRALPFPEAKQIPVIALTANAYLEDAQKCKEAGMNDHMSKPVQIEQIIRTVEKWMK